MADKEEQVDPLLQVLGDQGLLSEQQIEQILEAKNRTGQPVRTLLINMGFTTEDDMLDIIAGYLGTRVINLLATDVPDDVIHSVPASVARMYNAVPVEKSAEAAVLAISDLISPQTMDELTFVLTRDVSFVLAREADVKVCINQFYGDDSASVSDMFASLDEVEEASELKDVSETQDDAAIAEVAGSAPIIRFVNKVLYLAVHSRASDIHFEPFANEFKIRYRVDGALYEMAPPPRRLAMPVISRIKVMSGLNIAERRLPQDGRIRMTVAGKPIDLRVSTLPTQDQMESVVLRVLDRSTVQLDLENLGMSDDIYQKLVADIDKPNGIVIVTGPTGSGKTTTLYCALRRLNTIDMKLLTAEEPVEYDIEGIVQVNINAAIGNSFSNILRYFLRQDPDVMMIGEIRDLETAVIAIQSALTGHLVFSTLHTTDASGAVTRLIDMGVEPYLLSSTLEAVVGQRLLRTICDTCRKAYTPDEHVLKSIDLRTEEVGGRPFYYGEGCSECNNSGYKGRVGIYEYLSMTGPVKDLINEKKPTLIIRNKARELGMRTLREDGIRNILSGRTTVEEVLQYT
ncbi:MAG: GspE/PulE family protein [bacterium]